MAQDRCGVGKRCQNLGTNERLVFLATTDPGRRVEMVFRLPVCNDHLSDVPANTTFMEGHIALGDDAVSAD